MEKEPIAIKDLQADRQNPLKKIEKDIELMRDRIAHEFETTDNDWFSCFVSRLTVVLGHLEMGQMDGLIEANQYMKLRTRFDNVHTKLKSYRKQYPRLEKTLPPEEVREDLIKDLDILKEPEEPLADK